MSYLRTCHNCARKCLCQLIKNFNMDEDVGCLNFQEVNYQTGISNTLNEELGRKYDK